MKKHVILSATGRDRVGVADDLSAALAARRIDIENSRWTALGGQFALISRVAGEEQDLAMLERDLEALCTSLRFKVTLEPAAAAERETEKTSSFLIETFSTGPPGIGAVTQILKLHDANIEDMETMATPAPWSSDLAFRMTARITLPASCSAVKLREDLRRIERERNVDIVFKPIGDPVPEVAECLTDR